MSQFSHASNLTTYQAINVSYTIKMTHIDSCVKLPDESLTVTDENVSISVDENI